MCKQVSYMWARVLLGSLCVWGVCAEHFVQVCAGVHRLCVQVVLHAQLCAWEHKPVSACTSVCAQVCVQILTGGDVCTRCCTQAQCVHRFCVCQCISVCVHMCTSLLSSAGWSEPGALCTQLVPPWHRGRWTLGVLCATSMLVSQ